MREAETEGDAKKKEIFQMLGAVTFVPNRGVAHWQIGKTIVEFEKSKQFNDKSSRQLVLALAK